MAKCIECEARKGKRKCKKTGGMICSLCCGQTREVEVCQGCSFFKGQSPRNYGKAPYFELQDMAKYSDLQDLAELLEMNTLAQIDRKMDGTMGDELAGRLLERLLDKYHFGEEISCADELEQQAVDLFFELIANELEYVADDKLVKAIGAIRRSLNRRTDGHRAYLDFIGGFAVL